MRNLGEIEATLLRHPEVRETCVLKTGGVQRGDRLVGFAATVPGSAVTGDDLPPHLLPGMIGIMSKLPHTATGKIDRSRLLTDPAPLPAAMAGTDETPLENRLAPVLAGLLGHTNFTRERRFFELGPSSLELVILLQKEMQREIPLLVLLEHSTL